MKLTNIGKLLPLLLLIIRINTNSVEQLCKKTVKNFFQSPAANEQKSILDFLTQDCNLQYLPSFQNQAIEEEPVYENSYANLNENNSQVKYFMKQYKRADEKQFIKEIQNHILFPGYKYKAKIAVTHLEGCIYDDENIYVLMEPGANFFTLSNPDIIVKVRALPERERQKLILTMIYLLKIVEEKGKVHTRLNLNDILINQSLDELRLTNLEHLEDLTIENSKQNVFNVLKLLIFIDPNYMEELSLQDTFFTLFSHHEQDESEYLGKLIQGNCKLYKKQLFRKLGTSIPDIEDKVELLIQYTNSLFNELNTNNGLLIGEEMMQINPELVWCGLMDMYTNVLNLQHNQALKKLDMIYQVVKATNLPNFKAVPIDVKLSDLMKQKESRKKII